MIRKALGIFRKVVLVVLTLAAVGTAYLWVESHVRTSVVDGRVTYHGRVIVLWERQPHGPDSRGMVLLHQGTSEFVVLHSPGKTAFQHFPVLNIPGVRVNRFAYVHYGLTRSTALMAIEAPLWAPLLLFALYPIYAYIRGPLRRCRRRRKGLCLTCGYNLTGNVSGVCSECGEVI